jgi:SWI/SNF-related matrix-associated actin-dependent regulator of chromatin subfamily A3
MKDPSQNLRLLLQSLCLRRTKHSSQNITVNTELIKLSLSAAERTAYDEILEKTKQEMDHLVSSNLGARKYTKLFTAMHLLRVLCVQGTACRSWNSRSSSPTQPFEINGSEPRCEICDDEFTQSFKAECSFCPGCSRLLSDPPSSGGYFPGHLMLDSTGAHQTPLSPSSYSSLSPSTEPTLSTKLQSLLNNLIQHASLSKRYRYHIPS